MTSEKTKRPLEGIRVLEIGQLLAGPFTGTILGYFGAEIIKVVPPEKGDPIRGWREVFENGHPQRPRTWGSLSQEDGC